MSDGIASKANELAKYNWHGYHPWGNYGDGKWRLGSPDNPQAMLFTSDTISEMHEKLENYLRKYNKL